MDRRSVLVQWPGQHDGNFLGRLNCLQVAALNPPALKAVISIASKVDCYHDDIHYKNGCHLAVQLSWAGTMLDATGLGGHLAEQTRQEFGKSIVNEAMLSIKWYDEQCPALKAAFEDKAFSLPKHEDIITDFRGFKRIDGIPRMPKDYRQKGTDGAMRHGDSAIAALLAFSAANAGGEVVYDYRPVPITQDAFEDRSVRIGYGWRTRRGLFEMQSKMAAQVMDYEARLLEARTKVITAEAQGASWLQRTWRPIAMLTFLCLVVADSFGLTQFRLAHEAWTLLQIGLGGYVVGRSAEKVIPKVTEIIRKQ